MPIFDEVRGLVPLPRSKRGKTGKESDLNGFNSTGVDNSVFAPELPIPLPKFKSPELSNTVIDRAFTRINDVFQFIQLPVPGIINDFYKVTQRVENFIEDPVTNIKNIASKKIRDIFNKFNPKDLNIFPSNQMNSIQRKNEEVALLDLSSSSGGVRAQLLPRDLVKSTENLSTNEGIAFLEEPELNRTFKGIESLKNITLRSVDLWDIRLEAFNYKEVVNTWVPPLQQEVNSIINLSSKYSPIVITNINTTYPNRYQYDLDNLSQTTTLYPKNYSTITEYVPILSYNVDLKTLTSKQIELFGGSSIMIPELIRYTSNFNMQIVDDENRRWRRWLQTYAENLYKEETTSVAPYKNSSLLITLYQYRQDHKVLSHNKYICSLSNYQMTSMGAGSSTVDVIDIEMSIVGVVELPLNESYLQIV